MASATPDAAVAYDARQRILERATVRSADALWSKLVPSSDFDTQWQTLGPRLLRLLTTSQLAGAADARTYVPQVLDQLGIDAPPAAAIDPTGFAGIASDGRDLGSLLYEPVIRAKAGGGSTAGLEQGRSLLRLIVANQIQDAAREAVGVGIAVRPRVTGYVRMLTPPSCARCAILAGKWYRWNTGFRRHRHCDCRHIPATENVAGDLRTDPAAAIAAGKVTGLSQDNLRAIRDGADPAQVVNAYRGTSTAAGQRARTTHDGTTKRGYAHTFTGKKPRLMPSEIYRIATSREQAIQLLTRNGFVVPTGGRTIADLRSGVA